jgi:hypothetical protein
VAHQGKNGASTVQVFKPKDTGEGRRKLTISPLVNKKFYEWLRSSRSKIFKRKILPVGGLQRYYERRKADYVSRGGSPDAFDQAFDDVDISVAVDEWSSLDAELAKHLHEDIGKREEDTTAKELKEKIKSYEEQEREIEKKYAQYVADIEKQSSDAGGTDTATPQGEVKAKTEDESDPDTDVDYTGRLRMYELWLERVKATGMRHPTNPFKTLSPKHPLSRLQARKIETEIRLMKNEIPIEEYWREIEEIDEKKKRWERRLKKET